MTLIAFLPLLWRYSGLVNVPSFNLFGYTWLKGEPFNVIKVLKPEDTEILQKIIENFDQLCVNFIPGSLVWAALIASLGGLAISWFVGWYLPKLEYNNQKVEASFRKELVYAEDDKKNYGSVENLTELFLGIKFNYKRLFLHYGYFDLWVTLYDQTMIIIPYLVVGPGLFSGFLTLGAMVQISNAFQKVHNSFALFVHNWTTITELRSIWKRLHEFEDNLDKYQPK